MFESNRNSVLCVPLDPLPDDIADFFGQPRSPRPSVSTTLPVIIDLTKSDGPTSDIIDLTRSDDEPGGDVEERQPDKPNKKHKLRTQGVRTPKRQRTKVASKNEPKAMFHLSSVGTHREESLETEAYQFCYRENK